MIGLASDHNGRELKESLLRRLLTEGYDVLDCDLGGGTEYPEVAAWAGEAVARGDIERAVLVCGTGLGMAIAANKVPGVYAAPVTDLLSARLARECNDANVLTLGAWVVAPPLAEAIVLTWLQARVQTDRAGPKLARVRALERRYLRVTWPGGVEVPA